MAGVTSADFTNVTPPGELLLDIASLSKTFPGQVALEGASIHVRAGEVHALLGLNGSGKSTLIKILSGYHREDPGSEVRIFGKQVAAHRAKAGFPGKIAILHQDLGLIDGMSVAENMGLGANFVTTSMRRIRWREQRAVAVQACRRLGLVVDSRAKISALDASTRVLVGLVRAIQSLDQVPGSLVFADEPTAALGRSDVERVFGGLRELADAGAGVVVVTHRLDEVLAFCDSLTVLRDGRTIGEGSTADMDKMTLASLLTGRTDAGAGQSGDKEQPRGAQSGFDQGPVLQVRSLRGHVVDHLTFDVAGGEVVGVAGVVGSGREEVGALLVGATRRCRGDVFVRGKVLGSRREHSARVGVGYVPPDRKRQGLLARLNVAQNMTVSGEVSRFGGLMLDRSRADREIEEWVRRVSLDPPDPKRRVSLLSGGNQQKVVLSRWLRLDPVVFVLDDPMQGVDFSAKEAIYTIIRKTAARGSGIVLISSDSIELADVADRVLVIRDGRIAAELHGHEVTSERILMEVGG